MTVLLRTEKLRTRSVSPAEVRQRAERMMRALGLQDRELSVLLCDDATMRTLNRTYRGRDRSTDVLAFAMDEGEGADGARLLGDIVVSVDTAREQARRGGKAIVAEVTFLIAHGLLHLMGFDHRTKAEERRMKARTDLLVAAASCHRRLGKNGERAP